MIRSSLFAATTAMLFLAVPAMAQEAAPASPAAVSPQQIQQLIATLKQRNDQLRDMAMQMRDMEARVTAADAAIKERDAGRKLIEIATKKNRELAAIGESIIADYEKRKLGSKVGSSEPLTQLYRVKLQNKLQDYQDQIAAQGFYPERELQMMEAGAATPPAPANP